MPEYPDYSDYLHVVAAVIENAAGEILISKRANHLHQGGLWEFPGGKVEVGEETVAALRRELSEELDIFCEAAHPLLRIPYCYPDRKVLLDVWRITQFSGEAMGAEGQPVVWADKVSLSGYPFPAANHPIVMAAQLPSCYLITPDPGPAAGWPRFLQQLRHSLSAGIRLVQLRAPSLISAEYMMLATQVLACCDEFGARLLLNADAAALAQCDAAGVHLNARRLMAAGKRPVDSAKLLAASCHTLQELQQAQHIGVDFALLSPVKQTATHPECVGMGWSGFRSLSEQTTIPLYALGGMTPGDLDEAWRAGAQGIAGIGALWGNRLMAGCGRG